VDTLIFLAIAILPPLVAGPLPAMLVFRSGSGPNWRRQLPLAILSALVLNLIACAVIISNLDGLLPPGFFACSLTPIVAVATLSVSLQRFRRAGSDPEANPIQRKWLRLSLVAIPAFQMFTLAILVLVAPALCEAGLRTCTN